VGVVRVYSIGLLTAWFEPVKRVTAAGAVLWPERSNSRGKPFTVTKTNFAAVVLELGDGLQARLTANFYVGDPADRRAGLEIHGDEGSIRTEWFVATAPIEIGKFGEAYRSIKPVRAAAGAGEWYCDRSAGVFELWKALREDQAHSTSGEQAAHICEIIEAVETAVQKG